MLELNCLSVMFSSKSSVYSTVQYSTVQYIYGLCQNHIANQRWNSIQITKELHG